MVTTYQTTLFVLQNQADRSTEFLASFAEVIGSAFQGRSDKPSAIDEVFQEYWKATYSDVQEPRCGWPAAITRALSSPFVPNQQSGPAGLVDVSGDVVAVQLLAEEVLGAPGYDFGVTPDILVNHHDQEIVTQRETPLFSSKIPPSTPTRRHKAHSSSPSRVQQADERSPLTDVRRVPALSFYSSPTRKTQGDKENTHPIGLPSASVLGKRKLEDGIDESTVFAKRKTNSGSKALIHRSHIVMDLSDSAVRPLAHFLPNVASPSVRSKKRKVQFLDAVEIPTYRQVLASRRRAVSALSTEERPSSESDAVNSPPVLRRTRSASQLLALDGSPRKKSRVFVEDPYSSESESSLHDIQIAGSGKR